MKEINRTNMVAHCVGSLMVGLITVDKTAKSSGSVINLKQRIFKHTSQFQKILNKDQLETLSKICYDSIMELNTHESKEINPATIVEALGFTFEKELTSFYGQDFLTIVSRYSLKHGETAKHSYEIAKEIVDKVRKYIFDRLEK